MADTLVLTDTELLEVRKFALIQALSKAPSSPLTATVVAEAAAYEAYLISAPPPED